MPAKRKLRTNPEVEKRFYRLWRLWLLETDEADWLEGPYVQEYRQIVSMPFHQWWAKNKHRVADVGYTEYAFVPIKNVEDFHEYTGMEEVGEHIFKIGFSTPKHVLHQELDKLISLFHSNHESGHQSEYLGGIRSMCWNRKPTQRTVDAVLRIYKVYKKAQRMRRKNPNVFLYEIGAAAGLRTTWSDEVKQDTARKRGHSEKELMSTTTSHYLKWADEILGQLGAGEFPYFNEKKPRKAVA